MDSRPHPGTCVWLEPGLRRILAPNPSPMTHWGTNSYLLGSGSVALIDPGPDLPGHGAALLAALRPGERISHIFVTHAHRDHSPLARPMSEVTGAKVMAFGPALAGRNPVIAALGLETGRGEGLDDAFSPDVCLAEGDEIEGADWSLTAIHTPGHFGNHLCFRWGEACFSGDHVMGWASSLISPPDGDMAAYMASLAKLAQRQWRVFHPGHGRPETDPAGRLDTLARHRLAREAAILSHLARGPQGLEGLTTAIYTDVEPVLLPAARRNVLAHLVDLTLRNRVSALPALQAGATFALC